MTVIGFVDVSHQTAHQVSEGNALSSGDERFLSRSLADLVRERLPKMIEFTRLALDKNR